MYVITIITARAGMCSASTDALAKLYGFEGLIIEAKIYPFILF
jgi:hypothetical protein